MSRNRIETVALDTIHTTIGKALDRANLIEGRVTFEFSGVEFLVDPDSSADELYNAYASTPTPEQVGPCPRRFGPINHLLDCPFRAGDRIVVDDPDFKHLPMGSIHVVEKVEFGQVGLRNTAKHPTGLCFYYPRHFSKAKL